MIEYTHNMSIQNLVDQAWLFGIGWIYVFQMRKYKYKNKQDARV